MWHVCRKIFFRKWSFSVGENKIKRHVDNKINEKEIKARRKNMMLNFIHKN